MICDNINHIRNQIAAAAVKVGRDPAEIKLLAVSKRMGIEKIKAAIECGQTVFGENFVQEAADKIETMDSSITWHFIGHLQTNKAKTAARLFQLIETVDRFKLAAALNRHAADLGRTIDILIQVNIAGEKQKSGVEPPQAGGFIKKVNELEHLCIKGLMTMPPYSTNPEHSRPYFRELKKMADEFAAKGYFRGDDFPILSMGMSGDFTVAIEEGSTLVRVGTAIFGERPQ